MGVVMGVVMALERQPPLLIIMASPALLLVFSEVIKSLDSESRGFGTIRALWVEIEGVVIGCRDGFIKPLNHLYITKPQL